MSASVSGDAFPSGLDIGAGVWRDFLALCDCGGRVAGGEGERRAFDLIGERMVAATGAQPSRLPVHYTGWRAESASLALPGGFEAPCQPLLQAAPTPAEGLTAEVLDLGRGTPEEFAAHADDIAGRIVLVRHELMFAAGTVHRRIKLDLAARHGAVGFLVAGPLPGALVAGGGGGPLPAAGITPEAAARLRRTGEGHAVATLRLRTAEWAAQAQTLLFEIPGATDEWVIVSAHVDGHELGESAMDNATGVAGVMAVARMLGRRADSLRRGLRFMFFSVEEWGLIGSAQYVQSLTEAERAAIAVVVNLDSIAGSPSLSALTSGYAALEPFLLETAAACGRTLRTVRPPMRNSDHAPFAEAGIPALRLVAGYDEPGARLRHVLTAADTRDKVVPAELTEATRLAAAIVEAACRAGPATAAAWRAR